LGKVVLVLAHHAAFDRGFLERRLPVFATKHWACSLSDIDWRAEGIRSSALEFIAYSLGGRGETRRGLGIIPFTTACI
jgi:DNA polymerase-3 subunit epsilon